MKDMRERLEDAFPDWTDDAVDPKRVVFNSNTLTNRPIVADANTGEFFYATDTDQLFYFTGSAWTELISNAVRANYDHDAGVGSKATSEGGVAFSIAISYSGTTDGSGDAELDLTELAAMDGYTSASIVSVQSTVITPVGAAHLGYLSATSSTLTFRLYDYAAAAMGTQAFTADLFITLLLL
jgi:hypothetical protein